jgi:hypothetical protein
MDSVNDSGIELYRLVFLKQRNPSSTSTNIQSAFKRHHQFGFPTMQQRQVVRMQRQDKTHGCARPSDACLGYINPNRISVGESTAAPLSFQRS